ncbi:MAG: hypothetical protein NZ733_01750 [Aigarchaeota archaeon]|nr:hypothetical protein [Aigarchaeota archaeon]MCS7127073.1 hypothetical protein [Candidatus Calditenuaceae archaeon]MDW8043197.1 hypothetical protein [Nitrososphaerota archaeon]
MPVDAEVAMERAIEVARKAGWVYVWVNEVRREDEGWLVRVEALLRRGVIRLDSEEKFLEFREEPFTRTG